MARLAQLQIGTNSPLFQRTYSYDHVGNLSLIGDSLNSQRDQHFSYDERDRLSHACTASNTPNSSCDRALGYDESYAYDALGNLQSKGDSTLPDYVIFTYAGTQLHAPNQVNGYLNHYDANGNLTSVLSLNRAYTWNADNQPTKISIGALTIPPPVGTPTLSPPSRPAPTVPGVPDPVPPSRGGPTAPGLPSTPNPLPIGRNDLGKSGGRLDGTPPLTTELYTYDAAGERASRITDGDVNGANGITTLYFGGLWEQDKETGATRAQYAFAGHVIAQREIRNGTATLTYLHGDHLGSVSIATDSTGSVPGTHRQEYGPWGNVRGGGVSETTLNYTGQKRDGTGLLYYGARYYDPALGRFLSPDTITNLSNPQSLNRYSYVGNNPLIHTDPTGHSPRDENDPSTGGLTGNYDSGYNGLLNGDPSADNGNSANGSGNVGYLMTYGVIATGCGDPTHLNCANSGCTVRSDQCFPTGSSFPGGTISSTQTPIFVAPGFMRYVQGSSSSSDDSGTPPLSDPPRLPDDKKLSSDYRLNVNPPPVSVAGR